MCGIFGIINTRSGKSRADLISKSVERLFVLSESRGKESAGIAVKSAVSDNVDVLKASLPAGRFISSREFRDSFSRKMNDSVANESTVGSEKGISRGNFACIAHTRLVTNGSCIPENNQPVKSYGYTVVHNGIIVNIEELWNEYSGLKREFEVDSEFIPAYFGKFSDNGKTYLQLTGDLFSRIYGETSFGLINDFNYVLILATNSGSVYYALDEDKSFFVFASERFILEKYRMDNNLGIGGIVRLNPGSVMFADYGGDSVSLQEKSISLSNEVFYINRNKTESVSVSSAGILADSAEEKLLEFNGNEIYSLKRCSKCLLPETFPFIEYDSDGLCNYCLNYRKINFLGADELKQEADKIRGDGKKPDCLVTFSGGRDSSYGLHYIREELGLNPIAYTYDWGMVTDLARRNQSRLCGKLNIEHIVVSADINMKRSNIRKNVSAWLKSPDLGTVPLFMAGDKQYFYYANQLGKYNNLDNIILCENMLETTNFKSGFCGVKPNFGAKHTYSLSFAQKLRMFAYYAKQFISEPSYINSSLLDTFGAFLSYYFIPHNYLNIYDYIRWDEKVVEKTLKDNYDWELSPDTSTTWRIGDGTAAFYNYIYFTIAGFSEIETFRSNQIREGMLDRETAFGLIKKENVPRYESIKWYCEIIGIDFNSAVKTINKMPKLYRS